MLCSTLQLLLLLFLFVSSFCFRRFKTTLINNYGKFFAIAKHFIWQLGSSALMHIYIQPYTTRVYDLFFAINPIRIARRMRWVCRYAGWWMSILLCVNAILLIWLHCIYGPGVFVHIGIKALGIVAFAIANATGFGNLIYSYIQI